MCERSIGEEAQLHRYARAMMANKPRADKEQETYRKSHPLCGTKVTGRSCIVGTKFSVSRVKSWLTSCS